MQFGNWIVSDNSITWRSNDQQRFEIPGKKLTATRPGFAGEGVLYDWILKATDMDWLTENDLFDLNFAFVYGVAKFGLDFDYDIFDATLASQFEIFEAEDEENEQ